MANQELINHLQTLGPRMATGTLDVEDPYRGENGHIGISKGNIIYARSGEEKDLSAIFTMLAWSQSSVYWTELPAVTKINCKHTTDLVLFEFVQIEMQCATEEEILSYVQNQTEREMRNKRKTIRLDNLQKYALYLELEDSSISNEVLELKPGPQIIGKSSKSSDFKIEHSSISRRHCQIVVAPNSITVTDLGSTNGTFLNGTPVKQEVMIPGDILKLGPVALRLQAKLRRNLKNITDLIKTHNNTKVNPEDVTRAIRIPGKTTQNTAQVTKGSFLNKLFTKK